MDSVSWILDSKFDSTHLWTGKIRSSFNEGLYDQLKDYVAAIKAHASNIQRDAQARGLVENREARLIAEQTALQSHKIYNRLDQMHQQIAQCMEGMEQQRNNNAELQSMRLTLGQILAGGLADKAIQQLLHERNHYERRAIEMDYRIRDSSSSASPSRIASQDTDVQGPRSQQYSRDDLIEASKHLDDFVVGLDERDLARKKAPSRASNLVANRIQRWGKSGSAERLWLFGPSQSGVPSAIVGAAVSILRTALLLQLPVIAHACDRGRKATDRMSKEEVGIIGLVYSLIRQVIALSPENGLAGIDLSRKRFDLLDGSVDSWYDALDLLSDLLIYAPPLLLCLIDGLNRLEGSSATDMCEELLDRLDDCMDSGQNNGKIVKFIFTSSGNCKALRKRLGRGELCMVEDAPPSRQSSNNLGEDNVPLVLHDVFDVVSDDD